MDNVPREPAATRRRWAARGAGLPLGRRLAGVLTGLGVLPLLALGLNALLRGILTLPSHMLHSIAPVDVFAIASRREPRGASRARGGAGLVTPR
jgi:hypothetical protein